MNYQDEEIEQVVYNEYDYSNIIPNIESIDYLVQYCYNIFEQFEKVLNEDETKNEKLKYDLQNYNYKKCYGDRFEVTIRPKSFNRIECKNYESFKKIREENKINDVLSLEICLDLDYKRGMNSNLKEYTNSFKISFKPYEIKFERKSNHKEQFMNQLENNINLILKKFPSANSIFCTK